MTPNEPNETETETEQTDEERERIAEPDDHLDHEGEDESGAGDGGDN